MLNVVVDRSLLIKKIRSKINPFRLTTKVARAYNIDEVTSFRPRTFVATTRKDRLEPSN